MGFFIRPFTLCSPHTVRSQHSRCHTIALSGLNRMAGKKPFKVSRQRWCVSADFTRLYGLTQKQFKQLQPYIRISDDYRPAAELFAHQEKTTAYQRDTVKFPIKLKEGAHVLLNTADTSVLKKIPGIGSYFARQSVAYRNRLGGYSSVSQLAEIDDFPSETLSFFQLSADDASRIRKLNLNKLTLNELKRHPYISFYQARAIVDYRRLHGALHSLDDLKLLNDFSEDKIRQLQPYVEF